MNKLKYFYKLRDYFIFVFSIFDIDLGKQNVIGVWVNSLLANPNCF